MKTTHDPIMLSALEHYHYCPRQCGLIHIEKIFDENLYTIKGQIVHERVDDSGLQVLHGVRYERAMPLLSEGLSGKADMVEFHGDVPYPVEYKSGRRKKGRAEAIQLCAQALCLEEMLGVAVPEGALYWYGSRERVAVALDEALRSQTEAIARETRDMIESGVLPPPVFDGRCEHCSLRASCLPEALENGSSLHKAYGELFEESR